MEQAARQTAVGRRLARRALVVVEAMRPPLAHDAPIDLTQPAPEEPPPAVTAAANLALDRGQTHYTARPGISELCAALAARLTAEGFPTDADAVVVTNGGSEALYIALQSVVQPGGRVLLAGPVASHVPRMIDFIGGEAVQLETGAANRFQPTTRELAEQPGAVLLLGSPSAVTGVATPPGVLEEIVAVAVERGMTVILDRSPAWCCYDPVAARFDNAELSRRILTIGSFSDAYAMAGWRAGYFAAPGEHGTTMLELKQAMSICTSSIAQWAALAALEAVGDWLEGRRRAMAARRDAVVRRLEEAGLFVVMPDAWPWLLIDTRLIHPDDHQAAATLREQAGVAIEPASPYSRSLTGYTRLTLAADPLSLDEGLDRLIGFHASCF